MSALLSTVLFLLAAAATVVYVRPSLGVARAAAFATFLLSVLLGVLDLGDPATRAGTPLSEDALGAVLLPLSALIACAVLTVAPAKELTGRAQSSVLLSLAAAVGAFCARDLWVFTGAWIASLLAVGIGLPGDPAHARFRRAFRTYATLGTLPLFLALAVSLASGSGASFDGPATPNDERTQHVLFMALALAAAFRSGVFPLHSWLPALTERAPVAVSSLVFAVQLGPLLVARAVALLTPSVAANDLPALSTWAAVAALYAALTGIAQRDLKRALGFVLTSQSALLLFGVSGADAESTHGALLGTLAVSLCATGLLLLAGLLQARTGTSDLTRLSGAGTSLGRMAALFFLFGAATIGLPGSLAFVSEDLLLHGLLRTNPEGACMLLLVTVLNGITVLRLYFAAFQGPAPAIEASEQRDLTRREGLIVGALLALTFAAGLAPRALIALQSDSVRALAHAAGAAVHPRAE